MGTARARLAASGSCPAWIWRVSKPQLGSAILAPRDRVARVGRGPYGRPDPNRRRPGPGRAAAGGPRLRVHRRRPAWAAERCAPPPTPWVSLLRIDPHLGDGDDRT